MVGLQAVIIADDLTGALDSVAPFAALGLHCVAAVSPDAVGKALAQGPQVLTINLGSRELGADAAHALAQAAALAVVPYVGPDTIWLKKIDSRMKGHIGAEVQAVAAVAKPDRILLCPAIPDLGRIVADGYLVGAGVEQPIAVALPLPPDIPVTVPDAGSNAMLDHLLDDAMQGTLFVGARGIAAALARRMCPGRQGRPAPMPSGPVGFAVGSRDPVSLEQVALLRAQGGVPWIAAPDGVVPPVQVAAEFLIQATPGDGAHPQTVAATLANGVLGHTAGVQTLVMTGGETAASLLQAAGIAVLRVTGEVLPGLPLCYPVDAPSFPALVTKSGGFGDADCLVWLWQAAHCEAGLT